MRKLGIAILTAMVAVATVQAETLALWENDNLYTQTNSTPVDSTATDVSAGDLELGTGLVAPASTWENALDAYIYTSGVSNLTSAIANNHYFSFSVTPNAGKQIDYTNIFTRVTLNDSAGAGASVECVLMSSQTGFTTSDAIDTFTASTLPGEVTVNPNDFDVSGVAALQDQPSAVEFRLYIVPVSGSFSRVAMGHIFYVNGTEDVRVDGGVEDATSSPVVTLALWENDNLDYVATNSTPVDVVSTNNTTASDLEVGPGFAIPGFGGVGGSTWPDALDVYISDVPAATNLAQAILLNRYFTFTVTPDAGKQVDYSKVASRITLNDSAGAGASIQCVLMSSASGFGDGDEIDSYTVTTPAGVVTDNGVVELDVSGVAELQDNPSPVEFRLYIVLAGGSYSRAAIGHIFYEEGGDDVRVDGSIEDATSLPVVELAQWDLDGLAADSTSAAVDTVHSNMSSSALTAAPGGFTTSISWPDALGGYADWHLGGSLVWTLANHPNDYFSITLTPDAGQRVSYDSIFARFSVNAGETGANVTFHLLSDTTGIATNNLLGSFNVEDLAVTNFSPNVYTYTFDLSGVAELQNLTEATEFRIYATATSGNRMAIGHAWGVPGDDDLVVKGSIEELSYVPATILSWISVSPSVMKLVVDAPANPALYYPKGRTDLAVGSWAGVAHSDNASGPFIVTNLSYSTAEGDDEAIYVETTEDAKFFGIGEE